MAPLRNKLKSWQQGQSFVLFFTIQGATNMNTVNTIKMATIAVTLAFGATTMNAMALELEATTKLDASGTLDANTVKDNQSPHAIEFSRLDLSNDGLLTQDEAAKDKYFTAKGFAKADVDSDGTLDQNEYAKYKSSAQNKVIGRKVKDTVITAKAKAEILATEDLKTLQISVETRKGQVILSGFVDNEAARIKAEEVVSKIEGVKSVKNSLVVKS
jgi:hyperosmotically inducible protein